MEKKRLCKGILGVCLVLCLSGVGIVYAGRNDMTGATFRMEKTEGTVHVLDEKDSSISITEGMLLYSGDSVQTDAKSYAYINLDDSKLIKVDELSKTTLRKNGKKLELGVDEGAVYFEVNKKLEDDETMVIGDSTISLSIRGTTGVFRKRQVGGNDHYTILLLEGKATVACAGAGNFQIWGGERVDYVPATGAFHRTLIRVKDIPGFAAVEVRSRQEVAVKVMNAGLDLEWLMANADSVLAADQTKNLSLYGNVLPVINENSQQDSNNVKENTSNNSTNQSSGTGSTSGEVNNVGESGDTAGGTESTEGNEDTSNDSASTVDTITIKGADSEYTLVQGGAYPAYITYTDEEGNVVKVWLNGRSLLYEGLRDNAVLNHFEITITNFTETPEDAEYYGVGEITSISQITDEQIILTEYIWADADWSLKGECSILAEVTLDDEVIFKAEDIIIGDTSSAGSLYIQSAGEINVNDITSINGNIDVHTKLTVENQISNQGELTIDMYGVSASISCASIINDGVCSIFNMTSGAISGLSSVSVINNGELGIGSGITLKRLENKEGSYFEGVHVVIVGGGYDAVDDSCPITIMDGLIISDQQKTAGTPVYLSTDTTTPISGTFEGENTLVASTDSNGSSCFLLTASGTDSGDTQADSYTGQVISYDASSVTILDDATSTNKTITLGAESPMLNSLDSNGILTDFKATVEKDTDGKYIVTTAEQISADAVTIDSGVSLRDEIINFKGECTISSTFYLYGESTASFEIVNLITADQRGWIYAMDSSVISAQSVNVSEGILWMTDMAALNVMDKIEVDGVSLDWTYSTNSTIGTMELVITSGSCWISCEDEGQNEVLQNVSITNNGELVIDDTTVNSLTNGTSGTVENEGGNLVIVNP